MPTLKEDFKKERYVIPNLTVGGSTRSDVGSFGTTGNTLSVVVGATGVTFTVTGTRYGSTKFVQESFSPTQTSSAGGVSSTYSDWTAVYGVVLTDKYGMNMSSTGSLDIKVYSISTAGGSTNEVAYLSSGNKATKACIFALPGANVTVHNKSGSLYANGINYPSSNNSFELTAGMARDLRITPRSGYLMLESDTGGTASQVIVWED